MTVSLEYHFAEISLDCGVEVVEGDYTSFYPFCHYFCLVWLVSARPPNQVTAPIRHPTVQKNIRLGNSQACDQKEERNVTRSE